MNSVFAIVLNSNFLTLLLEVINLTTVLYKILNIIIFIFRLNYKIKQILAFSEEKRRESRTGPYLVLFKNLARRTVWY